MSDASRILAAILPDTLTTRCGRTCSGPSCPRWGVAGVRSGRPAVGGPDGPRRAVEVDCPDRVVAAPILMPLGFFLSVTRSDAQRGPTVSSDWCTWPVSLLGLER
jgi:hypothetical protein